MSLHITIPQGLKNVIEEEFSVSGHYFKNGELPLAWRHLERAHILGQEWPVEHTRAHWRMLVFAFRIKNTSEIVGQLPRLLIGGVKSFVGKIPTGNTGGADVPPLKPMEIPEDLKSILNSYRKN